MARNILSKNLALPTNTDLVIDLTDDAEIYNINSNVTLTTDVSITTTGTPIEGTFIWLYYNGNCTVDGNELEIFGTSVTEYADEKLMFYYFYRGGSWKLIPLNLNLLKIETGDITTAALANSAVTTIKLADNNVTTAKIADNNITTAKILDANVTTSKILDANITSAKLATSAVTTAKILNENVTTDKLANLSVTEGKIANAAIAPSKLEQVQEVIPVIVDITGDNVSGYANIPFKCTLKSIKYAVLEDLDGDTNDVTLAVNINGVVSTTVFQTILSATAGDALKGTVGTLTSSPSPGIQILSTGNDYVEIELSQTTNQGGKVQFFLVVDRTD